MTGEKEKGIDEVLNEEDGGGGGFNEILKNLNRMERKDCSECGLTFRGMPEKEICTDCEYKREHPVARDKYWTWSRVGSDRWTIVAFWPDWEEMPSVGEKVTVNRKDGSTSVQIIHEVEGLRYLPSGRAQLRCMVE